MVRKRLRTKAKGRKKVNLVSIAKKLKKDEHTKRVDAKVKKRQLKAKLETQRKRQLRKASQLPFHSSNHILLVGDGNLTFGRALVRIFRQKVSEALEAFGYPIPPEDAIRAGCPIDAKLIRMLAREQRAAKGDFEMDEDDIADELEMEQDEDDEDEDGEDMEDEDDEDEGMEEDMEDMDEDEFEAMMAMMDEDDEMFDDEDDDEEEEEEEFDDEDDSYEARLSRGIEDTAKLLRFLRFTYQTCATNLLVTCYDSLEVALEKYPDLDKNIHEIQSAGGRVVFDVDCTQMASSLSDAGLVPDSKFDYIVFNFPHVGSGEQNQEQSIRENQQLILGYLTNALSLTRRPGVKPSPDNHLLALLGQDDDEEEDEKKKQKKAAMAKKYIVDDDSDAEDDEYAKNNRSDTAQRGGLISLTLKSGGHYDMWKPVSIARVVNHNQFQAQHYKEDHANKPRGAFAKRFPKMQLLRKTAFFPEVYPGYHHVRTIGFKEGLSDDGNREILKGAQPRTFVFCRAPDNFVDKSLGLGHSTQGEDFAPNQGAQQTIDATIKGFNKYGKGGSKAIVAQSKTKKQAKKNRGVANKGTKRR